MHSRSTGVVTEAHCAICTSSSRELREALSAAALRDAQLFLQLAAHRLRFLPQLPRVLSGSKFGDYMPIGQFQTVVPLVLVPRLRDFEKSSRKHSTPFAQCVDSGSPPAMRSCGFLMFNHLSGACDWPDNVLRVRAECRENRPKENLKYKHSDDFWLLPM